MTFTARSFNTPAHDLNGFDCRYRLVFRQIYYVVRDQLEKVHYIFPPLIGPSHLPIIFDTASKSVCWLFVIQFFFSIHFSSNKIHAPVIWFLYVFDQRNRYSSCSSIWPYPHRRVAPSSSWFYEMYSRVHVYYYSFPSRF